MRVRGRIENPRLSLTPAGGRLGDAEKDGTGSTASRPEPPTIALTAAAWSAPRKKHISTSYVERQNLTMRMSMRRFTRLSNAFSKKVENLAHAVSLYFMYYNFGRIHRTLRVIPAIEAGVSDYIWTLEEIAGLLD